MPKPQKIRLGDLLVSQNIITQGQLESALKTQKKSGNKLGRELIAEGFISEDSLLDLLSQQLDIPQVNLDDYKLSIEVSSKLPELQSRRLLAMVITQDRKKYVVAMADPSDIFAYDDITKYLDKPFEVVIAKQNALMAAMDMVFRRSSEMNSLAMQLENDLEADEKQFTDSNTETVIDSPVAKFLQTMFEDAIQIGASDVHIEPEETALHIRLRQDGVLHMQTKADQRLCAPLISRLKLMSDLDISEKRIPQDGRFQVVILKKTIDVRLSTIPVQYGESAVMRLLDQSTQILDLDHTGMNKKLLTRFRRIISIPNGMVLVTGPTGSGKTTTLYSALSEMNTPDVKILTAEDPVEYRLPGINQVQINSKIGLNFADVLRAFLRQDPDIILVGEMRDKETVEIGMKAAMTGHVVLSTLHTNDAISTIARLMDMGAKPYLIAASLRAILAQRLIRKVCTHCKETYKPDEKQKAIMYSVWGSQTDKLKFVHGRGCTHCHYTGYNGRIAIHEFLELDKKLIRALQNADLEEFTAIAKKQEGFKSLRSSAMSLAAKGETTLDQVLRVAIG
ncbi:MAG: GspE/PulE family protein [Gammaproteobacteria bacterium]|nr:GspE/PulE family protein [Gammaproteobacteria bacterium]